MNSLFTDPGLTGMLAAAAFLASFMDSAVGGGGLITVPALMLTGWPLPMVLGTNKLAAVFGAATSALNFQRRGLVDSKLAWGLFPLAAVASGFGALTVGLLAPQALRPLVVVLLAGVLVFTLVKKDSNKDSPKNMPLSGLASAAALGVAGAIGFYDGFFGPGTGSFLIVAFLTLGMNYTQAAGNAKVLNLGSNLGAVAIFIAQGHIKWETGLVMGAIMIPGAFAGSQFAMRFGVRYLRPLFLTVTGTLLIKVTWDLLA